MQEARSMNAPPENPPKKVSPLFLILGSVAIVALVGFVVYTMTVGAKNKPKPLTAAEQEKRKEELLAGRTKGGGTESGSESEAEKEFAWSEIVIPQGRSPFVPGGAAKLDGNTPAEAPPTGPQPGETPPPTGPTPPSGAPPAGGGSPPPSGAIPPVTGPPTGGPFPPGGGGPVPGGPVVTGPPAGQAPTPPPSRLDRTNSFFRGLYPRSEDALQRPRRSDPSPPPDLRLTGTVVGSDGRPTAIVADGEDRYFVRPGQQLNVQGRSMRVLSVDRAKVVLQDERGAVTLQANGGAAQ
jgi:hypothetical protein